MGVGEQLRCASRNCPERRPRISLVTPNYNGAEFLESALQSVARQRYPNLDHVVVDGASTDGSAGIIEKWRAQLATVICERDRGHADALNKGFSASDGEIMGWINSDDVLMPGALDCVARIFQQRPDVEWITGRPSSMDERGEVRWIGPQRRWSRLRFLSGDNKWIQQESTFWRRSLWRRAGGALDLRYEVANDFELWARFFRYAELYSVDRLLGCFRVRQGQRSIKLKRRYEAESRRIIARELALLDAEARRAACGLLPRTVWTMRTGPEIRRDFRFAACDPPVLRIDSAKSLEGRIAAAASGARQCGFDRMRRADDLSKFKGVHAGERCFVMGNGPSLNLMDLSKLEGEVVFACNAAFLLFDRINWRPKYYVCVDSRVLPDRAADIDAMLESHPEMTGFFPAVLIEHAGKKQRTPTRLVLPTGPNRYFFNERPNSTDDLPRSMFSLDADEHVVQPHTVAITMLQLAAYMGFTTIYLIGCDTDYVLGDSVRTAGRDGELDVALVSKRDDDANHFDPTYFGRRRKWHMPRTDLMIRHYEHAKAALESAGVRVYNATLGGKLEVFPRVHFEQLFDMKSAMSRSDRAAPSAEPRPAARGGPPNRRQFGRRSRFSALIAALVALLFAMVGRAAVTPADEAHVWLAAGLVFLGGLIVVLGLRLREFVVELSQQILDIADGAGRPPAGSVWETLEAESELVALRDEVRGLKAELERRAPG